MSSTPSYKRLERERSYIDFLYINQDFLYPNQDFNIYINIIRQSFVFKYNRYFSKIYSFFNHNYCRGQVL